MLSHVVAAYSEGTDQYGTVRHGLANLLDQGTGGYDFTHGGTVNPNAVLAHDLGYLFFIYVAKNLLLKAQAKALFRK